MPKLTTNVILIIFDASQKLIAGPSHRMKHLELRVQLCIAGDQMWIFLFPKLRIHHLLGGVEFLLDTIHWGIVVTVHPPVVRLRTVHGCA